MPPPFFSSSFKGIRAAFFGKGEPTVVDLGSGLLELVIEPAKAKEAGEWLEDNHRDRYMVWNLLPDLDEQFQNSVPCRTQFVGRPPLLEEILKICHAMRTWIECDQGNIAIVLSTSYEKEPEIAISCTFICVAYLIYSTHISSFKAWRKVWQQRALATQGVQDFLLDEEEAAAKGRVDLPKSHLTYLAYIQELASSGVVGSDPLFVKRIVLHSIPSMPASKPPGCNPFVTITSARNGRLLYSSDWCSGPDAPPKTCLVEDLSVSSWRQLN